MKFSSRTPQEYERIKQQRKRQAEAASSDQQHGGATSSNIQTDSATGFQSLEGGTSSNIQTIGQGSIEETNMSTGNNIGPQTSGSGDQVKEEPSNISQRGTRPHPADSSDGIVHKIYFSTQVLCLIDKQFFSEWFMQTQNH